MTMTLPPETERLAFRCWQAADLPAFQAICSDPDVMQFVGDGEPWPVERTAQFIRQAEELSQSHGYCQWALIHKSNQALIGFCGFIPADNGAEIGWRLARDYWGHGLATEAARTVLSHGFAALGFPRITATVQSPNRASMRIIEKLGLKLESTFQRNGRDVLRYALALPRRN